MQPILDLSSIEQTEFARQAAGALYDLSRLGLNVESVTSAVQTEIQELLKLNEPETMDKRCRHFAVDNAVESDYAENFYRLDDGRLVLAGIRHLSGAKENPFVHMILPYVPNHADLSLLHHFAREFFDVFQPKRISFSISASESILEVGRDALIEGRNHVVGRVAEIKKHVASDHASRIRLESLDSTEGFDWYDEAYEEFHATQPHLKSWVPITAREELEACARDGLLFEVKIEGVRAGLIAAEKLSLLGLSGVYMNELLLLAPFRGLGHASALQRKFIDRLPSDIELVWGTIDARNLSSIRTARKVGRFSVRTEYFLEMNTFFGSY